MLNIWNKKEIEFRNMFKTISRTLEDYRCERCDFVAKELKYCSSYKFNEFLVLKLNTIWNNTYTHVDITDFDPDNIEIPFSSEKIRWRIKAVVFYEPSCTSYLTISGHYVCAVRDKHGWAEISDNSITETRELRQNLRNAYLIFLEAL